MTDAQSIDAWTQDIHQGDVLETLDEMPESSVHCVVTSPPYFGHRDYGVDGQIGLEESLDDYIHQLVAVGDATRRVLRDDGSWWLNLGDTYSQSGRKNKMLVPHRVAIALQDAGWIVRNDVTWVKTNPMPEPTKDRLSTTTEQVFHLAPMTDYWYDLSAIREPYAESTIRDAEAGYGWNADGKWNPKESAESVHGDGGVNDPQSSRDDFLNPSGKNPGDVFEVATQSYPDAHFAVYPPQLCEKPIKATAPPKVCCACGTPYERSTVEGDIKSNPNDRPQKERALEIYERSDLTSEHLEAARAVGFSDAGAGKECQSGSGNNSERVERLATEAKDVLGGYFREFCSPTTRPDGWDQSCDCDSDETDTGIVLDPFAGSGTTCLVAKQHDRRFIGIELNPEYVAMAQKRVGVDVDEPELLLEEGEQPLSAFSDGGST